MFNVGNLLKGNRKYIAIAAIPLAVIGWLAARGYGSTNSTDVSDLLANRMAVLDNRPINDGSLDDILIQPTHTTSSLEGVLSQAAGSNDGEPTSYVDPETGYKVVVSVEPDAYQTIKNYIYTDSEGNIRITKREDIRYGKIRESEELYFDMTGLKTQEKKFVFNLDGTKQYESTYFYSIDEELAKTVSISYSDTVSRSTQELNSGKRVKETYEIDYDKDGIFTLHREETFNLNGDILEQIQFNEMGVMTHHDINEYDVSGTKIKGQRFWDSDGDGELELTSEMYQKGDTFIFRAEMDCTYDPKMKGAWKTRVENSYDNLLSENIVSASGKTLYSRTCTYDDWSNLLTDIEYSDGNSTPDRATYNEYLGGELSRQVFQRGSEKDVYLFDNGKKISEQNFKENKLVESQTWNYDGDNLLRHERRDADGDLTSFSENEYDFAGRLVLERSSFEETKYNYGENGDLVSRVIRLDTDVDGVFDKTEIINGRISNGGGSMGM
ncbi:MAG: hypothetical protein ABIJ08_07330 [Nanoarchaeota archaeon]